MKFTEGAPFKIGIAILMVILLGGYAWEIMYPKYQEILVSPEEIKDYDQCMKMQVRNEHDRGRVFTNGLRSEAKERCKRLKEYAAQDAKEKKYLKEQKKVLEPLDEKELPKKETASEPPWFVEVK